MQYKYHNIIFDLDGTLINSGPGIIHAVQYALKKYGINETEAVKFQFSQNFIETN